MKVLRSPKMKSLLKIGVAKAKKVLKKQRVKEGTLIPLFSEDAKNGWRYQVDLVKDSRVEESLFVTVYSFKPPRAMHARSADYFLQESLTS